MSLADFQRFLIHIYTDKKIRDEFLQNPESMLAAYTLNHQEQKTLRALVGMPLELFCRSLRKKKKNTIKKILSKNSHLIIITSFSTPEAVIFFLAKKQQDMRHARINQYQLAICKKIREHITPISLMKYCLRSDTVRLFDLLNLTKIIHTNNLWNKKIKFI